MKNIYKVILALGLSFGAFSCTPYLDMSPTDSVSDKLIWETTENAEYHVNYLYTYLYDLLMNQCAAGQTEALTDMMKYGSYNYNALCFIPSEIAYGVEQTLTTSYVDTYIGYWGSWYSGIAKTNKALVSLNDFGKMSDEDKVRLAAEIRFIRASLYFDLMKRYKEIILYDEDLKAYSKNRPLNTEEEGWDFIYNDLKFAADNLPAKEDAKGRLSNGMAWAFMTRAMLYAERWEVVKTAAEEVDKLGYALEKNYADVFTKGIGAGNTEAIIQYQFDRSNDVTHSYDFYYTPGGDYAIKEEQGGGYGTPTQEMVESYELATGGFPNWTPWHGTTTDTPPYAELEPRFHATILYNGAEWKKRKIEPFVDGIDGWCQWNIDREPMGRTTTGYYLRKMVDETHDVIAYSGGVQPLMILRYAEVLLNKAEACYHLDQTADANAAIKAIRERVGLPYTDKGGSALWDAIRQERKVELAFEGLWYWDLRRWGVAHEQYPVGLSGYQQHGLKIVKDDNGTEKDESDDVYTYTYVSVDDQDRNFPQKMYRFPLPASELSNNKDVFQYPEWK